MEPTQFDASMHRYFRGCLGKKRYDSAVQAEEKARECEALRPVALQVYDCSFCGGWHLAKVPVEPDPRCGLCLSPLIPERHLQWCCGDCAERIFSYAA